MRRNGLWMMVVFMLWIFGVTAMGAVSKGSLTLDGEVLNASAYESEGRRYLPVRAVSEALGYTVTWSDPDQTIRIEQSDDIILLDYKDFSIRDNWHRDFMSEGKIFIDGRAYMPEGFFEETLGVVMDKDGVTLKTIEENQVTLDAIWEKTESRYLTTEIQYPRISGMADLQTQEALNTLFREKALASKAQGELNAADLEAFLKEVPRATSASCGAYFDYTITYNCKDILSIVFQDYQFAGGAHGGINQFAYTVNLNTGQFYELKDFFKEGTDYMNVINQAVKTGLDERELTTALFEPFTSIRDDQGFYLSNDGLVVYFQQYEILAYAAGIQEFTVEYDGLAE